MRRFTTAIAAGVAFAGAAMSPLGTGRAGSPEPAPTLLAGKGLYTSCAGCHGNQGEGRAEMDAPRLAGQDPDYLIRQLLSFRADRRGPVADPGGFQMRGRAKALANDEEVRLVIGWIRQLPVISTKGGSRLEPGQKDRAAALYRSCAACHGERGEGDKAFMAPPLRGLDEHYIAGELRDFRQGRRGADVGNAAGSMMVAAAEAISSDADIQLLSVFISDLHPAAPSDEK